MSTKYLMLLNCGAELRLRGHRSAERSYSMFKVRRSDLLQGKEHWLCLAGAAVKRYPMSKVRETQVKMVGVATGYEKANTLKP